jgi:catechol 2,3-dioxygenase-like lactoylglutathione lyase family enzyme
MAKKTKKLSRKAARPAARKAQKKSVLKKAAPKKTAPKKSAAKRSVARKAVGKAASKPTGAALVSVAPSFTANDAEASIKWYCDVLGFKVVERWEYEGRFMGAQLGLDNVSFNIGQDDWKLGRDRVKGQGTRMFITTGPDIDAYATAIKARGGVLAGEPTNDWGMRAFAINDPDGFKLTFMTPLAK